MDAVLATIIAGGRAQIRLNIKSIQTYKFLHNFIEFNKLFKGGLNNICARPPARQAAWIHQIHAAGGASGSITMVVVFVGCLCCCGWTRDVTSS
jgi:hypothetical protein